jgi:ubiquinone/menaquinone biosynthesis C-methylase UbiE
MTGGQPAPLSFDAGAQAYDRFMGRWSRLWVPALLDAAGVGPGQRVLDLASGTGEAAAQAADRVTRTGRVIGVDISLPMLRRAAARLAGQPVLLAAMDGTGLACPDRTFDSVICQLGLMLIPDPERATAECARVLHDGGRLSAVIWSSRERVLHIGILCEILGRLLPARREEIERSFSLGEPHRFRGLLERAGFREIQVTRERRTLVMESFEDYWEPVVAGGGRLGQLYAGLSDESRRAVREEVHDRMNSFWSGDRLIMEAEALLGVGRR